MPSQLLAEHRKLRTYLKNDINKQVHKRSVLVSLIKYLKIMLESSNLS